VLTDQGFVVVRMNDGAIFMPACCGMKIGF
jgi:hypothetical protein